MCARMSRHELSRRVVSLRNGVVVLSVIVALSVSAFGQTDVNMAAQPTAAGQPPVPAQPPATAGTVAPAVTPAGSYVAEAVEDDVLLRSGPGTNFYKCGKLYKSDRLQVVSVQQGWACIVPPPGCFSWIPMQYISINLDNPTMGIVTGDNVRIYAGSDFVEPMHSTSEQVKLFRGDNVKLLGEEKDDYYKIAPPQGAYLYVSTQFIKPVQAQGTPATPTTPVQAEGVAATTGQPTQPAAPANVESQMLDAYYALVAQMKAIHEKPRAEQNYTEVRTKLEEIVKNPGAGKAAKYAEFTLKQIERFELACTIDKEIELQKQQRAATTSKIDEARATRLAQIEDLGKFAVIGKLAASSLYTATEGPKQYRLLDETGKTIAYIAPASSAVTQDLSTLVGKKVGLVGEIMPHEPTQRAFIKYTQVVPIE